MSLQYLVHGEYKYPEKYKVEKILWINKVSGNWTFREKRTFLFFSEAGGEVKEVLGILQSGVGGSWRELERVGGSWRELERVGGI